MNIYTKTILVTGASRGIGKAIALYFAQLSGQGTDPVNYRIAINCRSRAEELEQVRQAIADLHVPVLASVGDVGDYHYCSRLCDEICRELGPIDILINNAGIAHIGLFSDMTPAEWNHILTTNLTSVYNLSSLCIPDMVHKKSGSILTISSVWGNVGASCEVAYSAAKSGIHGLTRALAKELAPSGIQVNAIACGAIDTEMNAMLSPEDRQALYDEIPAGRMGTPEEVAALAYSICRQSSYLTGQVITLDGGWT